MSHYHTLGVEEGASLPEIRQACLITVHSDCQKGPAWRKFAMRDKKDKEKDTEELGGESKETTKEKDLCATCGKETLPDRRLTLHLRTVHAPAALACPVCGRRFNHGGNLALHLLRSPSQLLN